MPRAPEGPKLFKKRRASGRVFWYIRWTPPGSGRSREYGTGIEGGPRPDKALAEFIVTEVAKATPASPTGDPAEVGIGRCLAEYAAEHGPETAGAGAKTIGYNIKALIAFVGEATVDKITDQWCKDYARSRVYAVTQSKKDKAAGKSPKIRKVSDGTIRRELTTLSAALHHAERAKRLAKAPTVWMPEAGAGKDRWLTRQEAAQLLRKARKDPQARKHLPRFILLALYTGGRKGALLDLKWVGQVDFIGNKIDFNPPGRKQTKKKRPVVPMTDKLAGHLRRWQRTSDSAYVISLGGERVGSIKTSFSAAARFAGLKAVTPNTLRHTCGTWQAQAGVDLWKVAGWLGHSHTRTTQLYAHHHPDFMKEARQALDRRKAG